MTMLEGTHLAVGSSSMLNPNQPMVRYTAMITFCGKTATWGISVLLPNLCPHMGAMLSLRLVCAFSSSAIACPFHALGFLLDALFCGLNKTTKSLLEAIEANHSKVTSFARQIWGVSGRQKAPIRQFWISLRLNTTLLAPAIAALKLTCCRCLLIMHDYNPQNGTHRALFEIEGSTVQKNSSIMGYIQYAY